MPLEPSCVRPGGRAETGPAELGALQSLPAPQPQQVPAEPHNTQPVSGGTRSRERVGQVSVGLASCSLLRGAQDAAVSGQDVAVHFLSPGPLVLTAFALSCSAEPL